MIEFEGKKFLNEQEAYLYCLEQIKIIKQSLGNALPDPIEGPQGEEGPRGPQGLTGERGNGIYGCSSNLPSATAYKEGDMYLLFNGQLYKKVNDSWVMQTTLKGPQGPIGLSNNEDVIANPVAEPTDELSKVEINGTVYDVTTPTKLFGKFVKVINAPESTTLTDEEKQDIVNGVFVNGDFLDYKNPIFFPATKSGNYYYGMYAGPYNGTAYTIVGQYQINPDNSIVDRGIYGNIELRCISAFNGIVVPNYPSSPANNKILVYKTDNTLEWQDKPVLYQHSITFTFSYGTKLHFNLLSKNYEPITTVDEILDYNDNYRMAGLTAVFEEVNGTLEPAVIQSMASENLIYKLSSGNNTIDYTEDISNITDSHVQLI